MSKWQIPYPQEVKVAGYMDSDEPIYFQNMTMKQSEERLKENDILILPIGSTECHGAHACYGEDTFLVTRMAEQVAKKTGCTVSQPIWFGSHPFTIWECPEPFRSMRTPSAITSPRCWPDSGTPVTARSSC